MTRFSAITLPALLPLVVLALVSTGCSLHRTPTLTVVSAEITERTIDGIKITFVVDAENTNDEPLPLRTATYALRLNGKTVFRGTRSPSATLRRHGTQRLIFPAVIARADLPPSGEARYAMSGSIRYVTHGEIAEILFDYNINRPEVGFSDSGVLDLGPASKDTSTSDEPSN